MKNGLAVPIACIAFLLGMAFGLICGLSSGKESGRLAGRCETYEAYIITAQVPQQPGLFPAECPQRRR